MGIVRGMLARKYLFKMKPSYTVTGADLVGRVQGMTCGFLTQLVFCQKKTLCFVGAEVKHETRLKNYVKRHKIVVKMVVP